MRKPATGGALHESQTVFVLTCSALQRRHGISNTVEHAVLGITKLTDAATHARKGRIRACSSPLPVIAVPTSKLALQMPTLVQPP